MISPAVKSCEDASVEFIMVTAGTLSGRGRGVRVLL